MKTRRLGRTELEITPVGFGAWAIGGGGWAYSWGTQEDAESIRAIRRAVDLGINWIDTAAVYGLGHSEEIVARALEGLPSASRPYVFTKCSLVWDDENQISNSLKRDSIRRECEASLRRLHVDMIDLYQIHWPNPDHDIEEAWTALADLRDEGKVRHIGVSNFNADQMRRAERIAPVETLQPPYSMLRRGIEADVLPYCAEHNIGVIVYSPMLSGLLTGGMTRERAASLPADDWRRNNKEFQEPRLSRNLALVERLREIGSRHGNYGPGEVAVAWALHHPAVSGAIVGSRSPSQIEGVVGAAGLKLTQEEYDEIVRFTETMYEGLA